LTCYFRHLKQTFEKAGIEVSKENKTQIDKAIHTIVGVKYKNCPAAGKEVRRRLAEDEEGFISELKKAISQRT
jgi:ribosomal protein L23